MKGWTPQAADRANSLQKGAATRPAAPTKGKPPAPREPTEKHVTLPPAPADAGPWKVAGWTIRRATAYEPTARVYLVGPSEEFEQLLDHLLAFTP